MFDKMLNFADKHPILFGVVIYFTFVIAMQVLETIATVFG